MTLYAVKIKSCDDGCAETVGVYSDPLIAAEYARRALGRVDVIETDTLPAAPLYSEQQIAHWNRPQTQTYTPVGSIGAGTFLGDKSGR